MEQNVYLNICFTMIYKKQVEQNEITSGTLYKNKWNRINVNNLLNKFNNNFLFLKINVSLN